MVTSPSEFQSKQMVPSLKMHTGHPFLKKARAYLWLTHVGSPLRSLCTLHLWGGGALLISF